VWVVFPSQVLAQSKQFIATYLERSSALLQPADAERNNNGASAAAVTAQTRSPLSGATPADSDIVAGSKQT